MPVTILYTAHVCTCCLMVLANDDDSGCQFGREPHAMHPHGLMSDITDGHAVPGLPIDEHFDGCGYAVNGQECDHGCETDDFSPVRCDGCGSQLAGTRHAVTALS